MYYSRNRAGLEKKPVKFSTGSRFCMIKTIIKTYRCYIEWDLEQLASQGWFDCFTNIASVLPEYPGAFRNSTQLLLPYAETTTCGCGRN